ncbi:MAG: class I SAM-dependent methyltransferase [Promethearchaeota archaeon]
MPIPPSEDRFQVDNRDPAISKKESMQTRYNSESYTRIYDGRYRQLQREKWEALQPHLPKIEGYWLDFGVGTGLTWEVATSNPHLEHTTTSAPSSPSTLFSSSYRYIGCDLARGMIQQFLNKLSSLDEQRGDDAETLPVNLICCDGEHLPLRNTLFDAIISLTTLQNLPHPSQGIAEIVRVANSTAPFGISVLQKSLPWERWEELLVAKMIPSGNLNTSKRKVETLNINSREYQEDWIFLITLDPEN